MEGMNREDIIRMAREAGIPGVTIYSEEQNADVLSPDIELFAELIARHILAKNYPELVSLAAKHAAETVAAAEREKVAHWMMTACYATGHGDTTEDLLRELAWQADERIAKAAAAEREACAKVLDEMAAKDKLTNYYKVAALAIRERGAP